MIELILTIAGLAAILGYFLYAVICALLCLRNERAEHRRMAPRPVVRRDASSDGDSRLLRCYPD